MPNMDGTGPLGRGRLTGRGLGPCGCGMRRGRLQISKDEEERMLEEEKAIIEKRLQELKKA